MSFEVSEAKIDLLFRHERVVLLICLFVMLLIYPAAVLC